jgi:hypothetical protein
MPVPSAVAPERKLFRVQSALIGVIIGESVEGRTAMNDPFVGTWKLNLAKIEIRRA